MGYRPTVTAGNEDQVEVPSLAKLASPERLSAKRIAKRFTPARPGGLKSLKTEGFTRAKIRKP